MMSINRNGKILHHNLGDPPRRKASPRLVCTAAVRSGLERQAQRLGSLDEFAVTTCHGLAVCRFTWGGRRRTVWGRDFETILERLQKEPEKRNP